MTPIFPVTVRKLGCIDGGWNKKWMKETERGKRCKEMKGKERRKEGMRSARGK